MRFERQPTTNPESIKIKVWQDENDGAHNGEYIGEIELDDEGQAWYFPKKGKRDYVLSVADLQELAWYMEKLETESMGKKDEIHPSPRYFKWIAQCCKELNWETKEGDQLVEDPNWFGCYDDGMTPKEAVEAISKGVVTRRTV